MKRRRKTNRGVNRAGLGRSDGSLGRRGGGDTLGQSRLGEGLKSAAFYLLLFCIASRCFAGEMGFRDNPLRYATLLVENSANASSPQPGSDASDDVMYRRGEVVRLGFAMLLLFCGLLWLAGSAFSGVLFVRDGWLGAGIIIFAVLSACSVIYAAWDKRSGWDVWIEQVSLLLVCFLVIQLCSDRRRRVIAVAVLCALGSALAIKGLLQYGVEIPGRIALFEEDPGAMLGKFGTAAGTPGAAVVESRVRDTTLSGYSALSNLFASMLIILFSVSGGLAGGKVWLALSKGSRRSKGEISSEMMAAGISVVCAGLAAAGLIMTRSRAGIISAALAFAAGGLAGVYSEKFRRHFKKIVLLAAVIFLISVSAVIAIGVKSDRLPGKSMTFRWFYWTATADIIRDNPAIGVGPGNFPAEYLMHRRAEAEESVKMPHNVALHAIAQYGLVGGGVFIAIIISVLVLSWQPGGGKKPESSEGADEKISRGKVLGLAILLSAGALITRYVQLGSPGPLDMIIDVIVIISLAGAIPLWMWFAADAIDSRGGFIRMALACGVLGFFLAGMAGMNFWTPGVAGIFWFAGGICIAWGKVGKVRRIRILRWPVCVIFAAGVFIAGAILFWPVLLKTMHSERAMGFATVRLAGSAGSALAEAEAAALADSCDGLVASQTARLYVAFAKTSADRKLSDKYMKRAKFWADAALARRGGYHADHKLIAHIIADIRGKGNPDSLKQMKIAIEKNPMDFRTRIEYAQMLGISGSPSEALLQLELAEEIEAKLRKFNPVSLELLQPAERKKIMDIRQTIFERQNGSRQGCLHHKTATTKQQSNQNGVHEQDAHATHGQDAHATNSEQRNYERHNGIQARRLYYERLYYERLYYERCNSIRTREVLP